MTIETVFSREAPQPIGPYSQAARAGNLLFVSGQTAQDPSTGRLLKGDIAYQTEQLLRNLRAILMSVGKDFGDVVQTYVYLTNMANFESMNTVYAQHFAEPFPARVTVSVSGLPLGADVEIALIAN